MISFTTVWHQYRAALLTFIITGSLSLMGYGAKSWADNNYSGKEDLAAAVRARDLKDINSKIDAVELEIQRAKIWLRFLPPDANMQRQIYGAEIELLELEKEKHRRVRQEALTAMGATIERSD